MAGLLQAMQGGLGTALSALGIPALLWGVALAAMGMAHAQSEYRTKGLLLIVGGALLASVKTVAAAVFG